MHRFRLASATLTIILGVCLAQPARAREVISLDGLWGLKYTTVGAGEKAKWHALTYVPADAFDAPVPGIVQRALIENGREPHPYYAMDYDRLKWVEDREWWYFLSFSVPESMRGSTMRLVFEGINYSSKIWLNGKQVGTHTGMFRRLFLDVGSVLKFGGKNFLIVKVLPPGKDRMTSVSCQMSYGWDFAPRLQSIGIWSHVRLEARGDHANFYDPYIFTRKLSDERAVLNLSTTVKSQFAKDQNVVLRGKLWPKGDPDEAVSFTKTIEKLKPKETRPVDLDIEVADPQPWWPYFMGKPNLYTARVELQLEDGSIDDEVELDFGIRTIQLRHNTDASIYDYPWTFSINGQRFYASGSNWVPLDALFRFDREKYREILKLAVDSGIKILRIWGGGIAETRDYYELCDELGILNWQEFWTSWGHYPKLDRNLFVESARDQINRLKNHPSLILWCGGNESDPDTKEHVDLIARLRVAVEEADPDRPFLKNSPHRGDEHNWKVWHMSKRYLEYAKFTQFRSEAGLQAPPRLESLEKFIPRDQLWPPGGSWGKGGHTFGHNADVTKLTFYAREYGEIRGLEDFILKSQYIQALTTQYNVENSRWKMYKNSGCLIWQFNEPWPSICWSMVDYYGHPKPSFYAFKRAAKPVVVVGDYLGYFFQAGRPFDAWIKVVNEKYQALEGLKVTAELVNAKNAVLQSWQADTDIEADSVVNDLIHCEWTLPRDIEDNLLFLKLKLTDSTGDILDTNEYVFGSTVIEPAPAGIKVLMVSRYGIETNPLVKTLSSYGVEVTRVAPVENKLNLPSKDPQKLADDYDVIFIHAGPDVAKLLGYRQIRALADAVRRGCGLVFDGGPSSYASAGFNDSPLEEVMPVEMMPEDGILLRKGKWTIDSLEMLHPLISGLHWSKLGAIQDYSVLIPSDGAEVVSSVSSGQPMIVTAPVGDHHAVALSANLRSGILTTWIDYEAFMARLMAYAAGKEDDEVVAIQARAGHYEGLNQLPLVPLDLEAPTETIEVKAKGNTEIAVRVTNSGDTVAFFTGLETHWLPKGIQALWNDNWISIWPGQSAEFTLTLSTEGMEPGDYGTEISLEGWNAKKSARLLRLKVRE